MDHQMEVIYRGGLRTEALHLKSGVKIITDAPVDNHGKGASFSPTDLACSALCSCMMTIMGILADREGIRLEGLKGEVVKIMSAAPRKIAEIHIVLKHPELEATEEQKEKLKRAALTCPVALTLGDHVIQKITFDF
jgi:putative redox protein